jgi:hypothetical protein
MIFEEAIIQNDQVRVARFDVPFLRSGEKTAVACPYNSQISMRKPLMSADVAIAVTFRPDYVPWSSLSDFRFRTVRQPDGTFRWLPAPYPGSLSLDEIRKD